MIKGIGTDLVKTSRIEASFERWGDRFAKKILTRDELLSYENTKNRVKFLSKRFAAKEAVAKALGTGMRGGVHFSNIEIRHHNTGAPFVVLYDASKDRADVLAVHHSHLSISDDDGYAIAFVVFD